MIGGTQISTEMKEIDCFLFKDGFWKQMPVCAKISQTKGSRPCLSQCGKFVYAYSGVSLIKQRNRILKMCTTDMYKMLIDSTSGIREVKKLDSSEIAGRAYFAMAEANQLLYVTGGRNQIGALLGDINVFDIANESWRLTQLVSKETH